MKVDFIKVRIEVIFDECKGMGITKTVGNVIHQNTSSISIDETARSIYHSERELEIPDEQISTTTCALSNASTIPVSAKKAALNLLRLTQE